MKDTAGKKLKIGDTVRIIGVPEFKGWSTRSKNESLPVFQHLVGKYKKINGLDKKHNCVEISFTIRNGKDKGWHWVAVESDLIKIKSKR